MDGRHSTRTAKRSGMGIVGDRMGITWDGDDDHVDDDDNARTTST